MAGGSDSGREEFVSRPTWSRSQSVPVALTYSYRTRLEVIANPMEITTQVGYLQVSPHSFSGNKISGEGLRLWRLLRLEQLGPTVLVMPRERSPSLEIRSISGLAIQSCSPLNLRLDSHCGKEKD